MSQRSARNKNSLENGIDQTASEAKSNGVRPEKVIEGKKLIADPGFPSDEQIQKTSLKILEELLSSSPRESG